MSEKVCVLLSLNGYSLYMLGPFVLKCSSGPVFSYWLSVWMIHSLLKVGSWNLLLPLCCWFFFFLFSSVQSLSCIWLFVTLWIAARQAFLSITNSLSPPKPMFIKSVMSSNNLILCHPLLLLPSTFPSISVFSNESTLRIRWSKYWNFSFSISPSSEHSGLIFIRMNWLDLLAVQGTLKSLLQHHSSKA